MAIVISFNGASIRRPASYSKTTVNLTGGFPIALTGIVGIVGEADLGAPGSAEDIRQNFYSPEEFSTVVDKYKSGPLVDAFKLLCSPSNDARIANGASKIYIYKTNAATKATATMPTAYGALSSKNYGYDQNTIHFQTTSSQVEAGPTFGMSWIVDENTAGALGMRVNGGALQNLVIAAAELPSVVATALNGLTGVAATGGVDRGILVGLVAGAEKIAITFGADGLTATITISNGATTWATVPTIGDSVYIPTGSVIAGAGSQNVGGYLITGVSALTLTVKKMADTLVSGLTVVAADIIALTDCMAYSPIIVVYDGTTPAGQGASVELFDNAGALNIAENMIGSSDRGLLTAIQVADGSKLSLTVISGVTVRFNIDSAFAATAVAGDFLYVMPGSILKGGANQNVGFYQISSATANTIYATKISGAPVTVALTDIVAVDDIRASAGYFSSTLVPMLNVSSAETEITVNVTRQSDNYIEDSISLGGNVVMTIGYDGTSAAMTINSINLAVTRVGGSGSDQTIKLANYDTIQQLVDYINTLTGYSAAVGSNVYAGLNPSLYLDRVSAVGICSEAASLMPGRILKDSYEIQLFFDESALVDIVRTLYRGLPAIMATASFLSGAVKGGTTAASVTAGVDEFQKVRVNSLIPLFSRNATDDIIDNLTEPSSSYQVSALNAASKTHALLMSTTKKRSERNAYCSYKGSYTLSKTEAQSLASYRVSLCIQDVKILKTDGTLDWVQPWGLSCIAAGLQAGAPVGEPMTYKFINISGITHSIFDPATQYDDAIDAGILFAEQPEQGGFRVVVGNTTYGADSNFVYNRISVVYAADTVVYNLRQQLENIYVGVNSAVANAQSIKNTVISILGTFLAAGIIKGDSTNDGKGYKNLIVTITGNVATVQVTITPAQSVDFVLNEIVLDNIRDVAA